MGESVGSAERGRVGAEQGRVLADVRRALGRGAGEAAPAPPPLEPFAEASAEEGDAGTVVARFAEEAAAVRAVVHRARHAEEACARAVEICDGACEVALSGSALLAGLHLGARLAARGLATVGAADFGPGRRDELIERLASCGAGVTAADYAIAETGTIVLSGDEEQALLVSLLPAVHVALVRARQIKWSLASVIGLLAAERVGRAAPCRSATFITGPSRTSDVELTLSIGVHGPKQLHLIILDD